MFICPTYYLSTTLWIRTTLVMACHSSFHPVEGYYANWSEFKLQQFSLGNSYCFVISVDPISTRVGSYAPTSPLTPPNFKTFQQHCTGISPCNWPKWNKPFGKLSLTPGFSNLTTALYGKKVPVIKSIKDKLAESTWDKKSMNRYWQNLHETWRAWIYSI